MNFSDKYNINITNVATEVVRDWLDTRATIKGWMNSNPFVYMFVLLVFFNHIERGDEHLVPIDEDELVIGLVLEQIFQPVS